jgi:hypothetical protein
MSAIKLKGANQDLKLSCFYKLRIFEKLIK